MSVSAAIPTGGEYASRALRDLATIERIAPEAPDDAQGAAEMADAALDLLDTCLHLAGKLPLEYRSKLTSALPFTSLEVELLRSSPASLRTTALAEIAARIHHWASGDTLLLDDSPAEVTMFLAQLRPHLDSWEERRKVDQMICRANEAR
ncbi:hypothetical protein [Pimelobacter simplex]|uniref:hypothetical protein n=1 Tax=Nocardioides simplex TaxID=2045 RepID=UPI0019323432|nr:hypothetical protein [Pimelobacter simplex]